MNIYYDSKLDKVYQYLLAVFAFIFPLSVAAGNIIGWSIVLIWLLSGDYKNKLSFIMSNALAKASLLFFLAFFIGMTYSDDIEWGLEFLRKMMKFLFLFPVFLYVMRRENRDLYINMFLISISLAMILSFLVWFEIIDAYGNNITTNPSSTMSHISYGPFLAIAFYIAAYDFSFMTHSRVKKILYVIFILSAVSLIFITGGRAGQVSFFVLLLLYISQRFGFTYKTFSSFLLISITIFLVAFYGNTHFKKRVLDTKSAIINYDENRGSALGLRFTYFNNSIKIISENFLFGVGTGDFVSEYRKISDKNSLTVNPHNMYLFVMTQLGLMGLLFFINIFYTQFKFLLQNPQWQKNIGLGPLALFILISFSDSYLLGHFTTFLFIFLSSIFFNQDVTKSKKNLSHNPKI